MGNTCSDTITSRFYCKKLPLRYLPRIDVLAAIRLKNKQMLEYPLDNLENDQCGFYVRATSHAVSVFFFKLLALPYWARLLFLGSLTI